jgi:dolichol-phosphate mannosyltransferase
MYNEQTGAAHALREVVAALERDPRRSALIVVNDGSRDGTTDVLVRVAPALARVIVLTHDTNRGYGAALQTGAREAASRGFDYVLYMDSDLTNSPDDIPRFVARMDEGSDVIKATRFSGGGAMKGVPPWRSLVSSLGNRVARMLFSLPLHDCTNGFRAVRVRVLQQMELTEPRFPAIVEELYWCKFLAKTYAEVPVVLANRTGDQRKTSFSYSPSVFWRYLKYGLLAFLGVRPPALRRSPHSS